MRSCVVGALALVVAAGVAQARPITVDGNRDALYGSAYVVQDTQTSFGSNSSLAAGYAYSDGVSLYLFFAGKLNTGFERLGVFIDSTAGGQNTLNGSTNMGSLNNAVGLTFDAAFSPDRMFSMNGDGANLYVDYGDLNNNANSGYLGNSMYNGANVLGNGVRVGGINAGPGLPFGFGLLGAGDVAAAAAYTTGIEMCIPLALIGNPVGNFTVAAFIAGGDGSTKSTQWLGGIGAGFANNDYGPLSGVNMNNIAGNQYFVIPAPASVALMGLGGLIAGRRRR